MENKIVKAIKAFNALSPRRKYIDTMVLERVNNTFYNECTFYQDNNFEVVYKHDTQTLELTTTFSNQTITDDWLTHANKLQNIVNTFNK